MPSGDFHARPFDEGTLTKLQIFELYAKNWLPVFFSPDKPRYQSIHLFDFFAGPGTDSNNVFGSPLRTLGQLKNYQGMRGRKTVRTYVHLFDESPGKIKFLKKNIDSNELRIRDVHFDIQPLRFDVAFQNCSTLLADRQAAKLVFIDQTGVGEVTEEVFGKLVCSPACDFLFFISSSTLNRFHDHPAIKVKIQRPDDHFHVHRAVLEHYRALLPANKRYFLAPFSIKKGANIYGLIFGSAHPVGIDKFLQVAWKTDEISGEADFDIDRENIRSDQMLLFSDMRPSKVTVFEVELERLLREGLLTTELGVIQLCFDHGVKRQHAEPVLAKLKKEGTIQLGFRVPDVRRIDSPRHIRKMP